MSRNPVQVRDAVPTDAASLVSVWGDVRRAPTERPGSDAVAESATAVARIAADPDQRLVVGLLDGEVAGAAHFVRSPLSPIRTEMAIHVTHLYVLDAHRRHGVGRGLIEAAVSWGEEKDSTHVLVAASVHSRDANRLMARLGLAQIAFVRGASIKSLRSKMPVEPPPGAMVSSRNQRTVGQVLARRRLQRRAQGKDA